MHFAKSGWQFPVRQGWKVILIYFKNIWVDCDTWYILNKKGETDVCLCVSFNIFESRMVEYSLDLQNINLSAIRTVRVLRPLKAINRVPSEKSLSIFFVFNWRLYALQVGLSIYDFCCLKLTFVVIYSFSFFSFSWASLCRHICQFTSSWNAVAWKFMQMNFIFPASLGVCFFILTPQFPGGDD